MSQKRKYLIAGNWKMNLNAAEGAELAEDIAGLVGQQTDVTVCLSPAFTAIESVSKVVNDSNLALGAQNMHFEASGAYTGEISAEMLRHLFASFVILGHSERREYFGETDAIVNKKTLVALTANLKPIVCVGETLEEREAGRISEVIKTQVEGALAGVTAGQLENLVIAYEPVWAIGTGLTPTISEIDKIHSNIRNMLTKYVGKNSYKISILYGGSVNSRNASEILSLKNVDGALVGGASLNAREFCKIID